jgi:nitrogenase molybdenum-iron protein alpha chain
VESFASVFGADTVKQTVRTFSQASHDEIIFALFALSGIEDAAVIVHGVRGCCASALAFSENGCAHWYTTDLDEKDTILGGDDKLRKTLIKANASAPHVIFVVGTPVIAINNDDIRSVLLEMEEEVNVPILFVPTDGFKSKAAVTGYDMVSHVLLQGLAKEGDKEDFVNLITLSERAGDVESVTKILNDLGIRYNALPQFSSADGIRRAGNAKATVALNRGEGEYLGKGLEEGFGVKFLQTEVPVGYAATGRFIREIGREFNLGNKAKDYVLSQEKALEDLRTRSPLKGKKVFLNEDLTLVAGLAEMTADFGGEIAGYSVPYVDVNNKDKLKTLQERSGDVPFIVANGQPFEVANALSKIRPDIYIGTESLAAFAAEFGVIPISLRHVFFYGYEGMRSFLQAAERAGRSKTVSGARILYKNAWLEKSGNWYVKQETR